MRTARFWACCFGVLIAGTAAAGDAEWTSAGPLGGGVFELKFHPAQPATAYATTRGAVYKTYDAGASWARVSDGLVASSIYPLPLALDLELPDTLYTFDASLRLYRTEDGGLSWQILDHNLPSDFLFYVISDVAGESGSLFIGGASQVATGEPQLFKSSDGGTTFSRIGVGLPADAQIATITVDPLDPSIVFVGIGGSGIDRASLFRSDDGGANFSPSLNVFGPPVALGYQPAVQDLSFIPGNGATGPLFAVVNYQIFHSFDGGTNWSGPHGPAAVITAHPTDPNKAYFGRADGAFVWLAPTPLPAFFPYNDGLTPNISYTSIPGNVPIRAAVSRLVPQPGYPAPGTSLFATTDGSGMFVRAQGAPVWLPSTSNPPGVGVRALAIHPHPSLNAPTGSDVLFAGHSGYAVTSPGLYRSTDQALSWTPFNTGIRANELQVIRIDPSTLGGNIANTVLYAGGSNAGVDAGYAGAGLFRSVNNGQNWLSMDGDLPIDGNGKANIGLIRDLALDPRSCPAPPPIGPCTTGGLQTIYALAEGYALVPARTPDGVAIAQFTHRVVRTNDLGATWIALDGGGSGLPASGANANLSQRITPTALVIDPNDSNRLYLGTEAVYDDYNTGDAIVPADLASGIFRSTDAGASWVHSAANGLPTKTGFTNTQLDVAALLIDPNDSNILWAALTDLRSTGFSTIYRSDDAGDTWVREDDGINSSVELRALAFDPQNPNILYAAAGGYESNPGAIYRGVWEPGTQIIVWLSISIGLPAESAYTIAVDPFNPNQLHAGTDAGVVSITRLPDGDGDGVPDATEDQAPDVPGGVVGLGDGNGDLIPDAAQRDVGSSVIIFRGAHGGSAITTDVVSGTGAGGDACSQAVDVAQINAADFGIDFDPDSAQIIEHPVPAVQIEVINCASAVIHVSYPGRDFTASGWRFRFFGPLQAGEDEAFGWHPLPGATLIPPSTWRLQLTANGVGSYRPEPDAIRIVAGPACFDDRLMADGFENLSPPTPSCSP